MEAVIPQKGDFQLINTNYKRDTNKCKVSSNNTNKLKPSEVIELVKDSITMEAGLDFYLGINLSAVKGRETKLIHCPFHGLDKTPSFAITPEKNVFHCFGCHVKGDIVTLVSLIKGKSQARTAFLIAEDFQLLEKTDPQLTAKIKTKAEDRELEQAFRQKEKEMYLLLLNAKKEIQEIPKANIKNVEDMNRYKKTYDLISEINMLIDCMAEAEYTAAETRVENFIAAQKLVGEKVFPYLKIYQDKLSKGVKM